MSLKDTRRKYKEEHREYFSEAQKKYYRANKDKRLAYHKKHYQENKDEIRKKARQYYKDNPVSHEKALWTGAKARAKKAGLEFTITPEDIKIPEYCPAIGLKLVRQKKKAEDNSPALERFDNNKGYTPENINVISHKANRMKTNATLEEVQGLLDWMKSCQ